MTTSWKIFPRIVCVIVFFFLFHETVVSEEIYSNDDRPSIGVYYFPGWKDGAEPSRPFPWAPIKSYPDRMPLLGWYQEGSDDLTLQHMRWMREYSIDYVIYDWYWNVSGGGRLDQAIESYLRVPFREHQTKFAIMWANHTIVPSTEQQFVEIVDHWVKRFFSDPRYETIDGRPILIVFSPENLDRRAKDIGRSASDMLRILRDKSVSAINKDPFVIGVTHAVHQRVNHTFFEHGYDAYTAYNYHYPVAGVFRGANYSRSYQELVDGYSITWDWMINNSRLPYILPVTSGWDRRPWGGSKDPLHDNSGGDPKLFDIHFREAIKLARNSPDRTLGRVHICCWNEYGEGSFIEPTVGYGFDFLKAIKRALLFEDR